MEDYAYGKAVGFELRHNYIEYTCWAASLINPDNCPIEDLVRKTMARNRYVRHVSPIGCF